MKFSDTTETIMGIDLFDFIMDIIIAYCDYYVKQKVKGENLTHVNQKNT